MQLFVRTLAGKTIVVEGESVAAIQQTVAATEGCNARLVFAGKQLEEGQTFACYGLTAEATIDCVVDADGGKKKKKKRKIFKGPKKNSHKHKNVPMRVLKYYKVEGDGGDEGYKVTRTRMECPHPDCGAGVFMAQHKNRQTCGKCSLTYVKK